MTNESNVTIKSNVTGTKASGSQITQEDKKKIHGSVLEEMDPVQFDRRIIDVGHSIATKKQIDEYLADLPCALCGKKGGKCGCGG